MPFIVAALLLVAFILLLLAAWGIPHEPRVSLGWLGLAFFVLAQLWPTLAAAV